MSSVGIWLLVASVGLLMVSELSKLVEARAGQKLQREERAIGVHAAFERDAMEQQLALERRRGTLSRVRVSERVVGDVAAADRLASGARLEFHVASDATCVLTVIPDSTVVPSSGDCSHGNGASA